MPNVEVIPNAQMTNRGQYLFDGVFGKSDFVIISSFGFCHSRATRERE